MILKALRSPPATLLPLRALLVGFCHARHLMALAGALICACAPIWAAGLSVWILMPQHPIMKLRLGHGSVLLSFGQNRLLEIVSLAKNFWHALRLLFGAGCVILRSLMICSHGYNISLRRKPCWEWTSKKVPMLFGILSFLPTASNYSKAGVIQGCKLAIHCAPLIYVLPADGYHQKKLKS